MSYTGSSVYLPASFTAANVAAHLGETLPRALVTVSRGVVRLEASRGSKRKIRLDASSGAASREEAAELALRAPTHLRASLEAAAWRVEIVPDDPRADPDDLYDALTDVFTALVRMPGAVGLDPFDGAFHPMPPAPAPRVLVFALSPDDREVLGWEAPSLGPRDAACFVHARRDATSTKVWERLPEPPVSRAETTAGLAAVRRALDTNLRAAVEAAALGTDEVNLAFHVSATIDELEAAFREDGFEVTRVDRLAWTPEGSST